MKTVSKFLILVCLAAGLGKPQLSMMATKGTNGAKISVRVDTRLEPSSDPLQMRGFDGDLKTSNKGFHRLLKDTSRRKYFGYDLLVERNENDQALHVSILPLSIGPHRLGVEDPGRWSLLALPKYPARQTLRRGEMIALDLFVNRGTGQRIVDYIAVMSGHPKRIRTAAGPARDFTVKDAAMRLQRVRLFLGGNSDATASIGGSVRGPLVWIYLPERGRFVFSLLPYPGWGFRRAGEVHGSTLVFEWDGLDYTVNCEGEIAPGVGAFHLYVLHDPAYRPSSWLAADGKHLMGSAGGPETLVVR